jgi:teichuronic acid biosynthesis glycosyltransferase TuaC
VSSTQSANKPPSVTPERPPKVVVVSEFYPRRADPVLGIWAHRQALAAQAAGAELRVLVLHRLIPPRRALTAGPRAGARALAQALRQPRHEDRDGLAIRYVPFISPSRSRSYASWGAWAAPALALALWRLREREGFRYEVIHAHNAVPAGDAVRRALARRLVPRGARSAAPLVVSVHGGDVLYTAPRIPGGDRAVRSAFAATELVLANSSGIAELARAYGARDTAVVRLGADTAGVKTAVPTGSDRAVAPALVTVGHLVARKRHADVMRALKVLSARHPTLRYVIIGDGPERAALEVLAARLGVSERVELCGQLEPAAALARMRSCTLFAMPSTEEAFGVAYIEAMAAGLPAIGCRGEPGPEEIAAAGDGFVLVPPGDIERLSQRIDELLVDPERLREAGRRARATVAANFTWERCGAQTVAIYKQLRQAEQLRTGRRPRKS